METNPQGVGKGKAMMKEKQFRFYEGYDEDGSYTYIIGETRDIKALYKSIQRAYRKGLTDICPFFWDSKFNLLKATYALSINEQGDMIVMSADTMLSILLDNDVREVAQLY